MSVLANLKTIPLTITAGTALTQGALPGDHVVVGLKMPPAWDAASLTFQVSIDAGVTWSDLYDESGAEVSLTPAAPAGKYLQISPDPFGGIECLKIRSGTSAAPVNQTANRTLILVTRKTFPIH
jgi:hypothetical protein